MKLVIFGLTVSSSWGNGHATLWRALIKGLVARGHDVVFFERDVPYYASHRDLHALSDATLVLYPAFESVADRARAELWGADAAIVTSYCPDAIAASELAFEARCRLRVFYDLDTPVTLSQLRAGAHVTYIGPRGLSDYDLVLSFTGGSTAAQLSSTLGARRVVELYGSVDPEAYMPAEPRANYRCDLSYMGTYADDRQAALQRLLIEPARANPQRSFLIGGAQYPEDFPWTPNIYFVRHVPPGEHPAFYASSRLTLNVTRGAMAETGFCPSGRLFEAAACATPILSDTWPGLDTFFEPGRELLCARTSADAQAALELSDAELARIGAAARERVLSSHTAAHRAAELEAALDDAAAGRTTGAASNELSNAAPSAAGG
jgi:spore maturation protein CgeB